jgi:hypothetical protein
MVLRGTGGSNLASSSAESATNLNLERILDVPNELFAGDPLVFSPEDGVSVDAAEPRRREPSCWPRRR